MVAIFIIHAVIGTALAVPYCLLAGWQQNCLFPMMFFLPIFLYAWTLTAVLTGIAEVKPMRVHWRKAFASNNDPRTIAPVSAFWAVSVYILLPIIMHWSARVLWHFGFDNAAALFEKHRYAILAHVAWIAFVLMLVLVISTSMMHSLAHSRAIKQSRRDDNP